MNGPQRPSTQGGGASAGGPGHLLSRQMDRIPSRISGPVNSCFPEKKGETRQEAAASQ